MSATGTAFAIELESEPAPSVTLTPELARDIFGWGVRSWSAMLPLWSEHIPRHRPLRALGIGEGNGGLSIWFAKQGIDVVMTDLLPLQTSVAALHARNGVSDRIRYDQADARALRYPDESFDLVFFRSVLGALVLKREQAQAISEMHRVLRPGGHLLFAENMPGTPVHAWLRERFVSWAGQWRYFDPIHDRDLFAGFDALHDATTGVLANLGRAEPLREALARADEALNPLVPAAWRMIWFGAAQKRQ